MAQQDESETKTLERGNIYFVYTPRVHSSGEETKVEDLGDIERTYMILSAQGQRRYRRVRGGDGEKQRARPRQSR